MTQRRAETAQHVRTLAPRVLRAVLALALCAGSVWGALWVRQWARTSPAFGLQTLAITGTERVDADELRRLGALSRGQNLFALDVDALERALSQHPWVRRVEATRRFPSTLTVEVEEYAPSAILVLGDLYLLDAQGVPFKRVQPGDGVDLPLVSGVEREAYVADPAQASARIREALEVARAYREAGLEQAEPLSEVRLSPDGRVLVTGRGQEVRLPEGDVAKPLERLARVRAELSRRGLTAHVIHLDNRARPDWVAVKILAPVSERRGALVQHQQLSPREWSRR